MSPGSLQRLVPLIAAGLVASVAAMVLAAGRGERALVWGAAAAFALMLTAISAWMNLEAWLRPAGWQADRIGLMRRNARLSAFAYAWGAAALFAVYGLSGLEWRHWWQYGLGMALFAAGIIAYVQRLGVKPAMPPLGLTLLHIAALIAGLCYFFLADKLGTLKADWAANVVFLAGGLLLVVLNLFAALAHVRLEAVGRAQA